MSPRQHTMSLLKFAREVSNGFLSGIPDDKRTHQSCPTDNHPLWVIGHIASVDEWFASVLGIPVTAMSKEWQALFGTGSTPTADPAAYPPAADVRRLFDANRQLLIEWLEGVSDERLTTQLSAKTHGFALDPIDLLLKGAWHEGWHMGQVASARKSLGLPRIIDG